jgi:elongation factor G
MEEDPVLRVKRDPKTHELLVSGTGQMHVEVTLARMKRKFGVDAILHPPKVPYLETIRKKVDNVEGKHKKQSGGRGQFGVCVINMEPLPAGSGIEFVDKIFGGSIPQNYRPAVEKGIREAAEHGWLAGAPVVDFRVTLIDGKYHNVDSSEMAFKIAGSLAFKEAMQNARPTILEPIMQVEIQSPEDCMGDIMGDLSQRRGKPQGMDSQGQYQVIKALVPMAEMLDYASTLKSITSDRASYTMEFASYEVAPSNVQEKITAEHAKEKEEKAG